MLEVEFARSFFPALATDWALLDNAGGSVAARPVIDRIRGYMSRYQVQLGATYPLSREAAELVNEGRAAAATLVNADPGEIVFAQSTTVNTIIMAAALGENLQPGDEVIVSNLDHESNVGPWLALESRGVVIREWKFRPDSVTLEADDLDALLNERTRLVCFTHVSNVVGAIHDVAEITRRAHAVGAKVFVDGVAFAPHRRVDVKALDVDFYALSFYKVYGPHFAMVYGRRELLEQAKGQSHFFIGEESVPQKLEPGNPPYELCASLPGILEYLDALDERHFDNSPTDQTGRIARVFGLIAQHEQALAEPLIDFLDQRPGVRIIGPPAAHQAVRVPTIAFTVEDKIASEVVTLLEEKQLALRFGHFYAYRPMRDLGILEGGVVRASMVHYNSINEIERLVAALDEILP